MADEKELEIDNPGKKNKMVMIIAIVAVVAIGGGAAFFFMGGDGDSASQAQLDGALDSGESSSAASAPTESASVGSALYVPIPRHFRFNVPGALRDRFVEIRVQLLVRGGENDEIAKKHVPLIESTLLAVFSQSNADDLETTAGKTQLKQKALEEVQKVMMEIESKKVVEQVLFTGFVMQ